MPSKKIVINLPDNGLDASILKGFNKRLGMLEGMIKDAKKKKKPSSELGSIKKEIRRIGSLKQTLSDKKLNSMQESQSAIVSALSALKNIRIPSPS